MAGNLDFRLNLLANTTGLQQGMDGAKFAVNALVAAMAAVGVGVSVQGLVETADKYSSLSARIQQATKENGNFEQAMSGVHLVALQTNSNLQATGDLFTRLNTVGKDMGMTQQQALDLTKTVTQAIQIGGGTAQQSEAAITQFIQAMQGGVLRGEEFNSMMENGYGVAEALAKGLGVTTGELRKMAENAELDAERVVKALQSQAGQIQATYDKFPTTIGNALQRITTSWEILIGKMDQFNGASSTVADWLVVLADNIADLDIVLNDIGEGFVWVGDQLKKIDSATIEALKTALVSAYDTIKELGSTVGIAFEAISDILNTTLSQIFNFNSGLETASDKTNGFTKLLQALNVVIGFTSDGFSAIGIGVNLLTGAIYDVASAFTYWKSKLLFGDAKDKALKEYEELAAKAQEYYTKASNGALEFKSKGVEALNDISKTQKEKDAESVASSKTKLESLLADQKTEVDGKKATEEEKLSAVQTYAEAAIKANGGVMDGTMQAELMTKGYIVTMNDAGKVSVEAWDAAAEGAERNANMADKARKAATALGLDLDVSLNRVSAKFKETEGQLNNFAGGLEGLGVEGKQAGEVTYQAWLKWLETAKSQAEIDMAKAKLQEFGTQGQISTSQVEQGLVAIKMQAQQLPDAIDPVTESFKRLGIQTKEQLRLSAQMALSDFDVVRQSGQATQADLQKAYEKTIQLAYASGDAQSIAAANAKAASLGLSVQVSDTGQVAVKSNDEWEKSNHRVRDSARSIGDGYRHAGNIAREEAKSSTEAWADALTAMQGKLKASKTGVMAKNGYSVDEIEQQLTEMGYSGNARQKAKELFETAQQGPGGYYRSASHEYAARYGVSAYDNQKQTGNYMFIAEQLEKLEEYAGKSGSTGSRVNVNNLAPDVSYPKTSTPTAEPSRTVINQISINGRTINVPVDEANQGSFNDFLTELERIKKSS